MNADQMTYVRLLFVWVLDIFFIIIIQRNKNNIFYNKNYWGYAGFVSKNALIFCQIIFFTYAGLKYAY